MFKIINMLLIFLYRVHRKLLNINKSYSNKLWVWQAIHSEPKNVTIHVLQSRFVSAIFLALYAHQEST